MGLGEAARWLVGGLDRKRKRWVFAGRERFSEVALLCRRFAHRYRPSRGGTVEIELANIARLADGNVALAALHVESGRFVSINGTLRVPMASVVKIPIAVQLLWRVDRGEISLDAMIPVELHDARPGPRFLARRVGPPGLAVSVRDLVELMLTRSDNTASDLALRAAGGVQAVRARLAELNLAEISVDRSIGQLLADLEGVESALAECTEDQWLEVTEAVPEERRRMAMQKALVDARDTCSAEAIVRFLAAIKTGQVLSTPHTRLLLDAMARCRTGEKRLKGLLPDKTPVAHKTGSMISSIEIHDNRPFLTADVGLIDLPANKGEIALAVFVAGSPHQSQIQDRVVARLARRVYEHYVAESGQPRSTSSVESLVK